MPDSRPPYRLLAPGPVPVPPQVLQAMSHKVLHHRTPEFERILRDAWAGLSWVFGTKQPVQILSGTGSAAMEAAVLNTLSPGDEALVVVSGKFGERWADMCERFGVVTHRWNLEWGKPADPDAFAEVLKKYSQVKVVFTEVCETSTATVHPIQQMSKLVRQHTQALFAVDAITAVGCMPLPMDEWDLDVVVAGSQKAFSIPTGLSFIALSARAWAAQAQSRCPKFYFDLAAEKNANSKGETYFSTPTPLIVGLQMVLKQWREAGLSAMFQRCATLAQVTRDVAPSFGLCVYSLGPSNSVTALAVPKGVDSAKVRDWLERERNITIMGGQDQLKGKILRVGHMGDVRDEDMLALFDALAEHFKSSYDRSAVERTLRTAKPLFT